MTVTHHGISVTDDYAWLRADNWQEVMRNPSVLDPGIRAYLEAENAYTEAALSDTSDLQATLFAEMKARLKEDDRQVPIPDGGYEYFPRFVKGGQYAQMCRMKRGGSADDAEVMLDGNAEAKGKTFWSLGGSAHSPDHKLLAWAADDKGSEFYTLKIRDLATGKDLDDEITETGGGAVWARMAARCFTFVSMTTTARCSSTAMLLARQPATMFWSMKKKTPASISAWPRRNRKSSS